MNLLLFGFKGSGKSFWGEKVAERTGAPLFDTDRLLEERTGLSPPALYKQVGETTFRRLEEEAIAPLAKLQGAIIALGGGAILSLKTQRLFATNSRFVYLKATLATIERRLLSPPQFLGGKTLTEVYRERTLLYAAIPALPLAVDETSEELLLKRLTEYFLHGL